MVGEIRRAESQPLMRGCYVYIAGRASRARKRLYFVIPRSARSRLKGCLFKKGRNLRPFFLRVENEDLIICLVPPAVPGANSFS
jgi:hypothetical protein